MGFLQRLFQNKDKKIQREKYKLGMAKTRQGSLATLKDLLTNSGKIDQSLYDRLEEIFILADIGVDTVVNFILSLKAEVKKRSVQNPKELEEIIVDKLFEL
ncbi:MAG: signal recognition particle-docking protein FtsY, partial [Acholeplasmataceae bacterium]|nr:signal recognition particle-docking protein FtsY [Acholeplasmataceae bacterium]